MNSFDSETDGRTAVAGEQIDDSVPERALMGMSSADAREIVAAFRSARRGLLLEGDSITALRDYGRL
ncbi:hypothetical protein [Gryllotalpicola koreensis]|uniref:Uncharacterized protein n=1 Tax=Gryllotalpicola koreensis TaxID=993086 RepID=A0ABP7ZUV5_9MICO